MYITNIKINNFRNIEKCEVCTDFKFNFIVGNNAQGKTNFLESIYLSNFYKSFRTKNIKDVININKDNSNINLTIKSNNCFNTLKVLIDKNKNKKIFLNNNNPKNKELYKVINSIIYYPSEINLLILNPNYRRNLIDRSIFFINNDYIETIKKYNKILKNRNAFLKESKYEFDPWLEQIIEISSFIIKERIEYIKRINVIFDKFYENKKTDEKYYINYKKYNEKDIKNNLYFMYLKIKEKEKKYKYTLFGPHLDDFQFFINNYDLKKYSSEGQKKYFLLNYKYSQLIDYKNKYDYYPILLFDDYSIELDDLRKKKYFCNVIDESGQIFITSNILNHDIPDNSQVLNIVDGKIRKI